jgi:predicted SAM-dependent methyltransferase
LRFHWEDIPVKHCLEIGPSQQRLGEEWITLDCRRHDRLVDYVGMWGEEQLPFADNSFELVYASHVLEHIPWYHTVWALSEARRILLPEGALEVHVPDLSVLIQAVQEQQCFDDHFERALNQDRYWMHWVAERLFHMGPDPQWHRACFNAAHLERCLQQAGFRQVQRIDYERGPSHGIVNLGMRAVK